MRLGIYGILPKYPYRVRHAPAFGYRVAQQIFACTFSRYAIAFRKKARMNGISSGLCMRLHAWLYQIDNDRSDRAGESDAGLVGNQLHALADLHIDAAAGGVEEGAVRKGIEHRRAGMDHGAGRESRDAGCGQSAGEGLRGNCGAGGCRGSCGSHQDTGQRGQDEGRHVHHIEDVDHVILKRGSLDDAGNRAGSDQQVKSLNLLNTCISSKSL